ncbi:hypothetical protein JCM10450v2_006538 [Rhodotorula kratochvilovae]
MRNGEVLRGWLNQIYDWFAALNQNHADDYELDCARRAFALTWWEFLPAERERIVDQLLLEYCRACTFGFDVDKVMYAPIRRGSGCSEAPASVRDASRRETQVITHSDNERYNELHALVQPIANMYRDANSGNRLLDGENAEEAEHWRQEVLSPPGISPDKLDRMGPAGFNDLVRQLKEAEQRLKIAGSANLPEATKGLPHDEDLLTWAEIASTSAPQRFFFFRTIFSGFAAVYSTRNGRNEAGAHQKEEQARVVARALQLVSSTATIQRFESLSAMAQQEVVGNTRAALLNTCRSLFTSKRLLNVTLLMQPIFHSLGLHPGPAGSASNPLVLESLAHSATSLGEISDRKARRYYGTTARAWQARRSAGGL